MFRPLTLILERFLLLFQTAFTFLKAETLFPQSVQDHYSQEKLGHSQYVPEHFLEKQLSPRT